LAKLLRIERNSTDFRSSVYGILADAFSPPKADSSSVYDALLEAHVSLQSTKSTPDTAHASDSPSPSVEALAREHLRLFVGPGHVPCPPYEAVYRKDRPNLERGLVMGPSTADVRRAYRAAGLMISKTYTDLPDHIAAEMEFMQFLCVEESKCLREGNELELKRVRAMQRDFLNKHIELWVPDFAEGVLAKTNSPFYTLAASLLKAFTKSEQEYFTQGATS